MINLYFRDYIIYGIKNSMENIVIKDNKFGLLATNQNDLRIYHRPFGKFMRKLIFVLLFFINMFSNFDHGAIPAATRTLKTQLRIQNFELGMLGSLIYLGLVLGALCASVLFKNYSAKWIVCFALIMSSLFLYLFTCSKNLLLLSLTRIGCGFFQVFGLIYFPVWVDEYGVKELRTYWLAFLQLGVPLGTMVGYLMEAYFIGKFEDKEPPESQIEKELKEIIKDNYNSDSHIYSESWKNAFYVQILLIIICVFILILTPDKFFSKNYKRSEIDQEEFNNEIKKTKIQLERKVSRSSLSYARLNTKKANLEKFGRFSEYSIFSVVDLNDFIEQPSYFEIMKDLFSNKIYLYILFCISSLLFIITGIQFWISDYMLTVLNVDQRAVFLSFSIVCVTAPTFGIIYGGYIIQSVGGYTNENAINKCFTYSIIAAIFGLLLPLVDFFVLFIINVWFLLFFGASIVPGLTGIMLNSLGDYPKEVANSLTHIFYNLLGYLPSPFLYGLICTLTGGATSRWGLRFLMCFSLSGVFFLYLAKQHKKITDINYHSEITDKNNKILDDSIQLNNK